MSWTEAVVDDMLDGLATGSQFSRYDLVSHASMFFNVNISPEDASHMLMVYQRLQTRRRLGPPKYVITCEGYGRAATWYLVGASALSDMAEYGSQDLARRFATRYVTQLAPAARNNPKLQPQIDAFATMVAGQLTYIANSAKANIP